MNPAYVASKEESLFLKSKEESLLTAIRFCRQQYDKQADQPELDRKYSSSLI